VVGIKPELEANQVETTPEVGGKGQIDDSLEIAKVSQTFKSILSVQMHVLDNFWVDDWMEEAAIQVRSRVYFGLNSQTFPFRRS
jgi:hypothetical protein